MTKVLFSALGKINLCEEKKKSIVPASSIYSFTNRNKRVTGAESVLVILENQNSHQNGPDSMPLMSNKLFLNLNPRI